MARTRRRWCGTLRRRGRWSRPPCQEERLLRILAWVPAW